MPNDPIFGSGNRQDPWQIRATELINWLYYNKQALLVEGSNITLTPRQDGTVEISASGGGEGTVTDVLVDGVSVVNEDGEAEITMPTVPSDIEDLDNVNITNPADGESLVYDATNAEWVNGEVGGAVDDVVMNGQSIVSSKVASFNNYMELTQSEYDALPVSKLTDGILYCIKDTGIVEGEKFAPVIYSLEEREIGVWTDGKPIYERSYEIGYLPNNSSKAIAHGLSNIEEIIEITGFCQNGNGFYIGLPAVSASQIRLYVNGANIVIETTSDRRAFYGYVILRYSKSTDVPGSGKWTTQGVPAHHYSTEEQVIGAWVSRFGNEVPLYEKLIRVGDSSVSGKDYSQISTSILSDLGINELIEGYFQEYTSAFFRRVAIEYNGSTKLITNKPSREGYVTHIYVKYTKSS